MDHGCSLRASRKKCVKIIEKEVEELASRSEVTGIFLGGSISRGTEWETSDIDLALVLEKQFDPEPCLPRLREGIPITRWRNFKENVQKIMDGFPASWYDKEVQWEVGWFYTSRCLFDRDGFCGQLLSFITAHRYDPTIVRKYVETYIEQARKELVEAMGLCRSSELDEAHCHIREASFRCALALLEYANIPLEHKELESQIREAETKVSFSGFSDLFASVWGIDRIERHRSEQLRSALKEALRSSIELISYVEEQIAEQGYSLESLGIDSFRAFFFPYKVDEYKIAIKDHIRFIDVAFRKRKLGVLSRESLCSYLLWLDRTVLSPLMAKLKEGGINRKTAEAYERMRSHETKSRKILGLLNPSVKEIRTNLDNLCDVCSRLQTLLR